MCVCVACAATFCETFFNQSVTSMFKNAPATTCSLVSILKFKILNNNNDDNNNKEPPRVSAVQTEPSSWKFPAAAVLLPPRLTFNLDSPVFQVPSFENERATERRGVVAGALMTSIFTEATEHVCVITRRAAASSQMAFCQTGCEAHTEQNV